MHGENIKKNTELLPIIRAVDFFCGAGGVTCGFRQAGINVLAGIDIDSQCKDTYEKNNHDSQFIIRDISKFNPTELESILGISKNDNSLIFVGCSPCQYYTNLKTDKTKSEESRLLLADFKTFVDYFRPGFIFIENVPGLELKTESPLGEFKLFLIARGYSFDDSVLNTKYYGVPQNRRRYMLIATRLGENLKLPKGDKEKIVTVREAIGNVNVFHPIPAGYIDKTPLQNSTAQLQKNNIKRIQRVEHDGGDRKAWANDPELQLKCYLEHEGHWDVYGRMFWDKPSPTITTRFCSLSNGRYGHPEQDRAISLREGATLQSFPLNYVFYAKGQGTIGRMIGNAVPPLMAKHIGKTILNYYQQWLISKQEQEH